MINARQPLRRPDRSRDVSYWPEASVVSTSPPRNLLRGNLTCGGHRCDDRPSTIAPNLPTARWAFAVRYPRNVSTLQSGVAACMSSSFNWKR